MDRLNRTSLSLALAALATGPALASHGQAGHGTQVITTDSSSMVITENGAGGPRAFAFAATPEVFGNHDWNRFMAMEMGDHGQVVKDAPYSAEAVTEKVQILGDGNRIVKRTVTLLYRDAAGRTRQEQTAPGSTVFINDPVTGKNTVLNVEKRTATVLPRWSAYIGDKARWKELAKADKANVIRRRIVDGDTQIIRKGDEGHIVQRSADGETTEIINEPGRQIVIKRREVDRGDGKKTVEENKEVRVTVVRAHGGDEAVAIAGLPTDINNLIAMKAGKHKGVTTSMGTRDFGGVKAEGTQTVATIPAGEIGNEKPIQIISEKWFSPELQAVVYSRQSDPRTGETIYRLNNVRRVAQGPELFTIPAGYTIKETRLPPMPPMPPIPPIPPLPSISPTPPAAPAPPAAPR